MAHTRRTQPTKSNRLNGGGRSLALLTTTTALATLAATSLATTGASAATAPTVASPAAAAGAITLSPFTASATSALLHVQALTGVPAADLVLSPASAGTNGKVSNARGANLDALALGTLSLSGVLTDVSQTSTPGAQQTPASAQLLGVPAAPVATAGVGDGTAATTDLGGSSCPSAGAPISGGTASVAGASVLPALPVIGDALDIGQTVRSGATTGLVTLAGQPGQAVTATATSGLTALTLLGGTVTVTVAHQPTLTATATGTPGTSSATYSAPIVTVTIAGMTQTLSAPGQGITIPGLGSLSLGAATTAVAPDGTSATASASLLHLDISPAGTELATVDLVPETATATAPSGGVLCAASLGTASPVAPAPAAATNPFDEFQKGVSAATVNAGRSFSSPLVLGNTASCTITDATVTDVVTGKLTLASSSPSPASASGGSYTYGPFTLAPGQVVTVAQTFDVPAGATVGTKYSDKATVTGTCDGVSYTGTGTVTAPTVDAPGTGACNLSRSELDSDHTQVKPGEDFDDVINLFNTGGADCQGVTTTATIPAGATFVSCTGGCTQHGNTVSWAIGTLAPGASRSLTVTLQASPTTPAGSDLPLSATVTAKNAKVSLRTTSPMLTGDSVLHALLPATRGTAATHAVRAVHSVAKTHPRVAQPTASLAYTGLPDIAPPALLMLVAAGGLTLLRRRLRSAARS